ncbi:hypothetical protein [Chlamydia pneumoniae]|uniref:hypothetical protein n=1 Tax=Chlamydia pneumoniae TaxID=83558 RepID=UPI00388FC17E
MKQIKRFRFCSHHEASSPLIKKFKSIPLEPQSAATRKSPRGYPQPQSQKLKPPS